MSASKMLSCWDLEWRQHPVFLLGHVAGHPRYNSNIGLIGDVIDANNCQEKWMP